MYKYFKTICDTDHVLEWKSKGLSNEIIKRLTTSNNSLSPFLYCVGAKAIVKFNGSYLKQNKVTYTHETIANISIVYELK